MKTTTAVTLLILCFNGLFAQVPGSTIYSIVNGNQVSIYQVNARQNCGFSPGLKHVIITDSIINWYQVDTLGIFYGCFCYFDYSVNIDSLNPGNYTANIYSAYHLPNSSDTLYQGSTTFTIEGPVIFDSIVHLTTHASACHEYNSVRNDLPFTEQFNVVSNSNGLLIENKGYGKITKIILSNLSGQEVFRKTYGQASHIQLPVSFLNKGVYIISIFDEYYKIGYRKVVVL